MTQVEPSALLAHATAIAREAGAVQRQAMGTRFEVRHKGHNDLVTEIDRRCETLILERIREVYPDHRIIGEEGGDSGGASPFCWYVDPLDGTTNFAHGFPYFAVSIAVAYDGRILAGAVYHTVLDELFTATAGGGAFLNDRPIHVSEVATLADSLLSTGFPASVHGEVNNVGHFLQFLGQCQAVRRAGSAALDLCAVACGRFEAFWEPGLKPWDVAAGSLIVQEAGGTVTGYHGQPMDPFGGQILATNGRIHAIMAAMLTHPAGLPAWLERP